MTEFRLSACGTAARALLTGFLITAGIGFVVSILEVHAAMGGLQPDAIATTIRGEGLATGGGAAESGDDLDAFADEFAPIGSPDEVGLRFGKGYREMLQTAHTHTFAIPLLFLALGAVFLGTSLREATKAVVLAASFVIIVLDLGGLWLTRYVGPGFAYVNFITGFGMSLCAAVIILQSLWDLWWPSPAGSVAGSKSEA